MNLKVALSSILVAMLLSANFHPPSSQASPARPLLGFEVNMTGDGNDLNPGDTICDASPEAGEQCSLRAAVQETNALSGAQEITLPAGTYLLVGEAGEDDSLSGDLDIKGGLTITGAGMESTIIDGGNNDRIFHIFDSGSPVTIKNLTVQHGAVDLESGGGISNSSAELTLENTLVFSNTAPHGGGIYNGLLGEVALLNCIISTNVSSMGGGILTHSELSLMNSTVSDNRAAGGVDGGGGIYNSSFARTTLTSSTIRDNNSDRDGAGIYNYGILTINDSTIRDNVTGRFGGGVFTTVGNVVTTGSTFFLNKAQYGGGLFIYGSHTDLTNSTISGNSVTGYGGGIYVDDHSDDKPLYMNNLTIVRNRANSDGSGGENGGGILVEPTYGSTAYIKNTILADNGRGYIFPPKDDCKGALVSQDYNLIEETAGCTISGSTTHDQTGVDPMLGFMADNGGPTRTHMPQPGSPVIDKANPAGCKDTAGATLAVDQRGYPRTVDGDGVGGAVCDVGAVEFALNPVPTLTSLSPTSTQAGGNDFILTVNGSEFVDGAVVQWKGADRTTTFVSATQLSAQINAADIASQGSASITVLNPEPGGGVSNALVFSITTPAGGNRVYLPFVIR